MARIENMATVLPPHVVPQSLARAAYTMLFAGTPAESRLAALFDHCGVEQRHFAFPPTYYLSGKGFDERNADYVEKALDLAEKAARALHLEDGDGVIVTFDDKAYFRVTLEMQPVVADVEFLTREELMGDYWNGAAG